MMIVLLTRLVYNKNVNILAMTNGVVKELIAKQNIIKHAVIAHQACKETQLSNVEKLGA